MIMFCPKCGALLVPKSGKMVCLKHGSTDKKVTVSQKTTKKVKLVGAAKEEEDSRDSVDNECPKCEHRKAFGWMRQTRAADEAPTRFYECKKCHHKWKEYS